MKKLNRMELFAVKGGCECFGNCYCAGNAEEQAKQKWEVPESVAVGGAGGAGGAQG